MRESTVRYFRQTSHFILVGLSIALSVNLFMQFSDVPFIMGLFGLLAVAFELIKLYLLIVAKSNYVDKKFWKAFYEFVIYFLLAAISALASLGFVLVSIQQQTFTNVEARQSSQFRIESTQQEIADLSLEINILTEGLSEFPANFVTARREQSNRIEELRNRRDYLRQELLSALDSRAEDDNIRTQLTSEDMFSLLGQMVNISGYDTMYYMMLLLVILLEIAIALTTGEIIREFNPPKIEKTKIREQLIAYIDSLFDRNSNRLKTDKNISDETGLPIEVCSRFRTILSTLTYKGRGLIESTRGGTFANFSKENISKIVLFHLNTGNSLFD